jgi:uncharacterized membrane protein
MDHLQNELKKEFQIERLILFSDAVFAIAITLLSIDLKVPELSKKLITDELLVNSLLNLIPKFVAFLLSYFIIGLFWMIHHRTFAFVINYNRKLLILNLVFLLSVVLMPFSTSFYSEYVDHLLKTPVIVYVFNICFLGISNIFVWRYVSNEKNHLSEGLHPVLARYYMIRSVTMPAIFLVMLIVYLFISPAFALWIIPLVPLIIHLITRKHRKMIKNLPPSTH